jgi:hypothetical protein
VPEHARTAIPSSPPILLIAAVESGHLLVLLQLKDGNAEGKAEANDYADSQSALVSAARAIVLGYIPQNPR